MDVVEKAIQEELEKVIAEQMWDILESNIKTNIYGKYSPGGRWVWGTPYDHPTAGYQRRMYHGGLLDESFKYIDVDHAPGSDRWILSVSTTAEPSESVLDYETYGGVGSLLALLEEGNLGFWSRSVAGFKPGVTDPFPRPVIPFAQKEVDEDFIKKYKQQIQKAIVRAIKKESGSK